MDARLLRDELVTLLLAGHETTALALTWTLYLLSQHPEIATQMEEEVDAALGPERLPVAADLGRLPTISRVSNYAKLKR
jgi:cytochrome P450